MLTMAKTKWSGFPAVKKSPLSSIELFRLVPPSLLLKMDKYITEKRYAKHSSIFLEDDRADFVWFVLEGHVKETHHSPDGRSQTLSFVGPGGLFGVSAFDGGKYGFHGIAETEAVVLSVSIQSFRGLMEKVPELARAALSQVSRLLRHAKDMQTFSQESAEKRLLHVLVEMSSDYGATIPLTRREIAEMAGTAVETCIRAFSRLETAGFIASVHGKLTIKDMEGLKERLENL